MNRVLRRGRAAFVAIVLAPIVLASAPWPPAAHGDEPPAQDAFEPGADEDAKTGWQEAPAEADVLLPGDRARERVLDRARRLVADQRWADAAATLDELLAIDQDAFVSGGDAATRGSIRSETGGIVARLPRAGRETYERLFGSRAARELASAIAADDAAAIVAIARRWLHTPAGRQAALLTAVRALEADQPLAASAWLDRLAASPAAADLEPTLAVMRAAAASAAGDETTATRLLSEATRRGRSGLRLAGRDLTLPADGQAARAWLADAGLQAGGRSAGPGEWRQFRGLPTRNGVVEATRPLLVPRYRVPLVRHPEEARRLDKYRQGVVADGGTPMPAGTPVAVGSNVVVQTPLGILAIDFDSGRRLWLQSAVAAAAAEPDEEGSRPPPPRVFHDATIGNLASDGTLVFAVESRPESVRAPRIGFMAIDRGDDPAADPWEEGNVLSAYALEGGRLRWRLAGREPAEAPDEEAPSRWHLGPPLVVGDELFLLVEREEEVRLEVRAAADATLLWTQPLATYDQDDLADRAAAVPRRLAGLSPALAEGVLVCPIGAGCVVALDVATRSLLWAHAYPRPNPPRDRGGFRNEPPPDPDPPSRGGEPTPVIAGDRVILAPFDTELLICLGLEDGTPLWQRPRGRGLSIAGSLTDRLLLVDGDGVEAVDLATGKRLWQRTLGDGVRPSGRGIVTPRGLLVPCDAPAVIEVAATDGSVTGRSVARGGGVPGNLVAHHGEVISRGVDSLDVFHQEAALEERIETALRTTPGDPSARYWRGQSAIERGDVAAGLDDLAGAADAPGFRIPPGDLAAAVARAMQTDFPTAARRWAEFPGAEAERSSPEIDRLTVDGFLAQGDPAAAWTPLARLLSRSADGPPLALVDATDGHLSIVADRWLQSRLARVTAAASEPLRGRIDAACRELAAATLAQPAGESARRDLETACDRLGRHPAADGLRERLRDLGNERSPRWELLTLEARGSATVAPTTDDDPVAATAWPLGQVDRRETRVTGGRDAGGPSQSRPMPLAAAMGFDTPAARAAIDVARQRLTVTDSLGRPLARPLPVAGLVGGFGLSFLDQSGEVELAALGRLIFVRTAAGVAAHRLADGSSAGEELWVNRDAGTETEETGGRWGGGMAGRVARDGAAPLGLRIGEPDERPRGGGRGMAALPTGLVVPGRRSVAVLDAASGSLIWERSGLPPGLEWFVDGDFLCGCTVDGRDSLVLAMLDGRLVHRFDVPHRRQRVAALGRRFVAVQPLDDPIDAGVSPHVRLDLVDAADREIRPLGTFDGRGRATETGDGRLAVLEPGGRLTVLDLADGGLAFRRELAGIPRGFERLFVQPWRDRYLVLAGASEGEDPSGAVALPLEQLLLGGGAAAPLSGVVWAVDRVDGRPLWPGPAVIDQQCLHTSQPPGLPVMVFCRRLKIGDRDPSALSLLCLDKRTGHAVLEDDRIELEQRPNGDCSLSGDPSAHTVTVSDLGTTGGSLTLTFTGRPMAPRPPFRSRGRPPAAPAGGLFDSRAGAGKAREER